MWEETITDCAYGDGATRQAFAAAGRPLIAKVPALTNQGCFPKTAFTLDLQARSCTCPAGQVSHDVRPRGKGGGVFRFSMEVCAPCPLRAQCVRGRGGRTIQVHPQEGLLQEARRLQASPAFTEYRRLRQVVEHRLARLVQLGIRQARYLGSTKTLFLDGHGWAWWTRSQMEHSQTLPSLRQTLWVSVNPTYRPDS